MGQLIPETRIDKNGVAVIRHVRAGDPVLSEGRRGAVPGRPSLAPAPRPALTSFTAALQDWSAHERDWSEAIRHAARLSDSDLQAVESVLWRGDEEEVHTFLSPLQAGEVTLLRDMLWLYRRDRHGADIPFDEGPGAETSRLDIDFTHSGIIISRLLSDRESALSYLRRTGRDCGALSDLTEAEIDRARRWLDARHAVEGLGGLTRTAEWEVQLMSVGVEGYRVHVRHFEDPELEALLVEHPSAAALARAHGTLDPARLRAMMDVASPLTGGAL